MPVPPMMAFAQKMAEKKNDENVKARKEDVKSSMMTFWEQMIDMQKSAMEASKEQWNQFFKNTLDIEDTFAAIMPDEAPSLFGFPLISPKAFMKNLKEFQEVSNAHFVEQLDSAVDFRFKGKERVRDMVNTAMEERKKAKEEAEKAEEAAEEENSEE
jgi:hypothetical protein